ncbi:hypothetical protein BDW62DRAFT_175041 [Aspergillus aurantiobrunneus]
MPIRPWISILLTTLGLSHLYHDGECIIIGADYFSRYVSATTTIEASAAVSWAVISTQVVPIFGWPTALNTDNGPP